MYLCTYPSIPYNKNDHGACFLCCVVGGLAFCLFVVGSTTLPTTYLTQHNNKGYQQYDIIYTVEKNIIIII